MSHVKTVDHFLYLEVGFASEIGATGLYEAIVEALKKAGTIEEANIIYIRAKSPHIPNEAVDIWVPEPRDINPPPIPIETSASGESPVNVG